MLEIDSANLKSQPKHQRSVVVDKALFLLDKHATKSSNGFIRLPEVRRVWSWLLHLSAEEVYLFLKELEEAGLVSRLNSHGIRILKNQEGRN